MAARKKKARGSAKKGARRVATGKTARKAKPAKQSEEITYADVRREMHSTLLKRLL